MKKWTKTFSNINYLATLGLLGALGVVLSYVATIEIGPYLRVGFSGLPNRVVEFLFGPIVGAIFGGCMDIIKYFLKPTGPYFFGFTLDAILAGVIYGLFLYKKEIKIWRIAIAEFLVKLIVNCGLNTLWISILYGKGFFILLPTRLLKNAIMLPIDTLILFGTLLLIHKVLGSMRNSRRFLYPFEKAEQ